jgi:hypothetical protein
LCPFHPHGGAVVNDDVDVPELTSMECNYFLGFPDDVVKWNSSSNVEGEMSLSSCLREGISRYPVASLARSSRTQVNLVDKESPSGFSHGVRRQTRQRH